MPKPIVSYSTRKALEVHLGEEAGREIVAVLQRMADAVAALEKKKVDITPIAPINSADLLALIERPSSLVGD